VTACDSRRNIHCTGTLSANGYCAEAQCETVFVMKSTWRHQFLFLSLHCTDLTSTVDSCILLTPPMTHMKDHKIRSKIYPIIRQLNSKFQLLYLPRQDTSVDVSQMLWKGSLSFTPSPPLKSSKFRIKTFKQCKITFWLSVVLQRENVE
jgi:hypothetical protein